tara:strand:- start:262 stop:1056 length:795 start_codon:yes stop_codon:yes gene_type:complete
MDKVDKIGIISTMIAWLQTVAKGKTDAKNSEYDLGAEAEMPYGAPLLATGKYVAQPALVTPKQAKQILKDMWKNAQVAQSIGDLSGKNTQSIANLTLVQANKVKHVRNAGIAGRNAYPHWEGPLGMYKMYQFVNKCNGVRKADNKAVKGPYKGDNPWSIDGVTSSFSDTRTSCWNLFGKEMPVITVNGEVVDLGNVKHDLIGKTASIIVAWHQGILHNCAAEEVEPTTVLDVESIETAALYDNLRALSPQYAGKTDAEIAVMLQ